jgi:hypothetical protein
MLEKHAAFVKDSSFPSSLSFVERKITWRSCKYFFTFRFDGYVSWSTGARIPKFRMKIDDKHT